MRRKTDEMQVPQVIFLAEQDGPTERELKEQLVQFFVSSSAMKSAYLARISYDRSSAPVVALCLRAEAAQNHFVTEDVGSIFSSMFATAEHLDIVFLDELQEIELLKVCRPFFSADQ